MSDMCTLSCVILISHLWPSILTDVMFCLKVESLWPDFTENPSLGVRLFLRFQCICIYNVTQLGIPSIL